MSFILWGKGSTAHEGLIMLTDAAMSDDAEMLRGCKMRAVLKGAAGGMPRDELALRHGLAAAHSASHLSPALSATAGRAPPVMAKHNRFIYQTALQP